MELRKKISIVLASDNQYSVLIAALIKSIEVNHKTKELLSFTIIDDGISRQNKKKLINTVDSAMTTIRFVKSAEIVPASVKMPPDQSTFPFTTYLRVFSPYTVDAGCEKLIYMDVDMLLYDDISKLFLTDIGNNIVGAVQDTQELVSATFAIPNYKELGIPHDNKYFNSGLLLINRKKWIENDVSTNVIQSLHNNMKYVNYPDQYGLNVTLYNNWFQLDKGWNRSAFDESEQKPKIIHFVGIKPMFKSCNSIEKYRKDFFKILDLTSYSGFKPKNDYHRIFKKGLTKAKKIIYKRLNHV